MKRTCPAKTRIKTDIIEFFFQDDPCMDLASRLIWNLSPELQADKIQQKQFFCQITKCSFEFLSFDNFSFSNFQVLLRRLKKLIFCQIIMGSQLNNNVSKGRSVIHCRIYTWTYFKNCRKIRIRKCRYNLQASFSSNIMSKESLKKKLTCMI